MGEHRDRDGLTVSERTSSPRGRIAEACSRRGEKVVVMECLDMFFGRSSDDAMGEVLAGAHAQLVGAGAEGGWTGYWPRVWAMRGLLYAWNEVAVAMVIEGTGDSAWRVREMAAKVTARRLVGDAFEAMTALADDPVERVRKAANRALTRLVAAET